MVFTRHPKPGTTKTRLIEELGETGAADLQRRLTEHTLARAEQAAHHHGSRLEIWHDGDSEQVMQNWLGFRYRYQTQNGGDLGERMHRAFVTAFAGGAPRAVLIGTDCPQLTSAVIGKSLASLTTCDLAVGPAADGGYYLIGMRQDHPGLFTEMPWGTRQVLQETLIRCREEELSVYLLPTLNDIDRPTDLSLLSRRTGMLRGYFHRQENPPRA